MTDRPNKTEPAMSIVAVRELLESLGFDVHVPALADTPRRVASAFREMLCGYDQKVEDFLTVFEDECDELVICRGISFSSLCERAAALPTGRRRSARGVRHERDDRPPREALGCDAHGCRARIEDAGPGRYELVEDA